MHRDIKPANILVNKTEPYLLKLADFGEAIKIDHSVIVNDKMRSYVVSRYYRAPELLLQCTQYNESIDWWSAALIIIEMHTAKPFLMGDNSSHQLRRIMTVLGTPNTQQLNAMHIPADVIAQFAGNSLESAKSWSDQLAEVGVQQLATIVDQILVYEPARRAVPKHILQHEYFAHIRGSRLDWTNRAGAGSGKQSSKSDRSESYSNDE